MSFILYTPYYEDSSKDRQQELLYCLSQNIKNPSIKKIELFIDSEVEPHPYIKHDKIHVNLIGRRCKFGDLVNHAKVAYYPDEIIIIANTDIYFNDTLHKLLDKDLSNIFITLTRWDLQPDNTLKIFNHDMSADTFIFKNDLKPFFMDYHLGYLGVDNLIPAHAQDVGYEIKNPCLDIQTIHYHITQKRNYTEQNRYYGKYIWNPHQNLW